jgi:hypothetical protein
MHFSESILQIISYFIAGNCVLTYFNTSVTKNKILSLLFKFAAWNLDHQYL